jgi:hypothetical protein
MVVPVDTHVYEAQQVAEEYRQHRRERRQVRAVRDLHLQHHDCDDDGDHAVAESLKSVLLHREASVIGNSDGHAHSLQDVTHVDLEHRGANRPRGPRSHGQRS